ncbi:hypothetical protein LMG28614_06879 [Paraburkholderia ultramafica]|uniref:Uncharacterized protein n=1 Tax=Paraburkholderia ultramafica TaxID=1544867 RepID=A0A6S7DID5_9BURK|nr:hypothetical protein [Paraburkholderia ultramafica]CAB3808779.1 hypothetical protein LMG28614_06879 [Paraburkholderia ultramafica]
MKDDSDCLPALTIQHWKRIRGEQAIIARIEPEQALLTLSVLLAEREPRGAAMVQS